MKILLATDGSECSFAALAALEAAFTPEMVEQVTVVGVSEAPLHPREWAPAPGQGHSLRAVETEIGDVVTRLRVHGYQAAAAPLVGDPAREILRLAREERSDLIVLGRHGRKGLERFLLGSVSEAVMRGAACPVMVAPQPAAVAV